jgi:hypothetical protein
VRLPIAIVAVVLGGAPAKVPPPTVVHPTPFVVALSSVGCAFFERRLSLVTEIRTEQQYARDLGGVVDMAKLYRLQCIVRAIDEETERLSREAEEKGITVLLPCSDPIVARLAACRDIWREDGQIFSGWRKDEACALPDLAQFKGAIVDPL